MVILMVATMPATAQWLNVPTKGMPRTKDGKPDLSAPTPRKPDGKPDLSGIWHGDQQNNKYGSGSGLARISSRANFRTLDGESVMARSTRHRAAGVCLQ